VKTFTLNENERLSFEIENIYISVRKMAKVLASVPGVENIQIPRLFRSSDDIRLSFKIHGHDYMVVEPFGDSSRYWIVPRNPEDKSADISTVRAAFDTYLPPLPLRVIGSLLGH